MFDDGELSIGSTNGSEADAEVYYIRGPHHRSPFTSEGTFKAHHEPITGDAGNTAAAAASAESTRGDAPHVLTSHQPRTTPLPSLNVNNKSQKPPQKQCMSDKQAAAFGESLMRVLSGEEMLESFLRKYPRPTPGSGVGVGPIKSTTQGTDSKGRPRTPGYHVLRQKQLREKRRRLRELQDWEYKLLTTPARHGNSAAVGLLSFGMTFILFGLHYTGHFKLDTVVPAMAICFGGGAQLIAGLLAWTQSLTFAYVSFVSCGAFFLSITCIWMLPNASFKHAELVQPPSAYFIGAFYSIWGVYTVFLFFCTVRMNLCMFLKVLTTVLCFFCLGGGLMAGNDTATHAGGYFGIITGAVSLYLCFASIINEVWDAELLPVFQTTHLLEGYSFFGWMNKKKKTTGEEEEEKTKKQDDATVDTGDSVGRLGKRTEKTHTTGVSVLPSA